jgi:cytosine/adenosine deaminase-related metal-dependent hydrolase
MPRRVLRASWVLPISAPPIADGAVTVEQERITWVGAVREAAAPKDGITDLGDTILMPGTVNAHCHLELSHLAGRLPRERGFVGWVEALVNERGRTPREEIRRQAAEAMASLRACGTAALGDVSNALDHLDLLEGAGLDAVVFYELLAWDPARAAEVARGAQQRLAGLAAAGNGHVRVRLAAHAPYSVSPALFEALRGAGGPAAVHLAESPDETAFIERGGGALAAFLERRGLGHVRFQGTGTSPVQHLEALGVLRPGLLAAHCVQVDARDRDTLARRGVQVVLCPRSNRNLGVGLPPLPELLRDGVPLALGTDSLASVESLDVLDDAAVLHRAYPDVEPAALVHMATSGGARALGLAELGSLAPGKRAATLACTEARGVRDPYAFLVSGEAHLRRVAA